MATGLIHDVWELVYYMSELRCLLPWQQPKMGPGDTGTEAMAPTSLAERGTFVMDSESESSQSEPTVGLSSRQKAVRQRITLYSCLSR